MTDKSLYKPINCGFYDELIVYATQQKQIELIYQKNNNKMTLITSIKDVFTKDKAEYILLKTEDIVRLDFIFSIDGKELPNSSCSID